MSGISREEVLKALHAVIDVESGSDIVSLGWITSVQVKDGHVTFILDVPHQRVDDCELHRQKAESTIYDIPGVLSVTGILTTHQQTPYSNSQKNNNPTEQHMPLEKLTLSSIKSIIAIASGKGGVGKSTIAINLALAFAHLGLKTGLFDADIYGPSVPRMMGLRDRKPEVNHDESKLLPLENYNIKVMSIGFMVPEDAPIIWRGPMVIGALEQLLRDVEWGNLDVLVVDLPPGTGDTQLTISQRVPLTGVVIISTPQDIALLDARKGLNMFRRVEVPILGIIENMSYYICPKCGHREEIFSHGGAQKTAEELNCSFLGAIPLDIKIREASDQGIPLSVLDSDGSCTQTYIRIAQAIWNQMISCSISERKAPRFVSQ